METRQEPSRNIDLQALKAQSDRLLGKDEASLQKARAKQIAKVQSQLRSAVRNAGDFLPENLKEQIMQFAGSEELRVPEKPKGKDYEAEAKAKTLETLQSFVIPNGAISVSRKYDVDRDMAGGYDVYQSWTITNVDGTTIIEKTTREVGNLYSRGSFDDTFQTTTIVDARLEKPMRAKIPFVQLRPDSMELGSWYDVANDAKTIADKALADRIATDAMALLEGQPFRPGNWPESIVRERVTADRYMGYAWRLAQASDKETGEPLSIGIYQEGAGDNYYYSRLNMQEGTFDSFGTSGSSKYGEEARDVFIGKLGIVKSMLEASPNQ